MIDLGAGMGLCGLVVAALGSHVISTDLAPVLPLLRKNCESNFSPVVLQSELLLYTCRYAQPREGGGHRNIIFLRIFFPAKRGSRGRRDSLLSLSRQF